MTNNQYNAQIMGTVNFVVSFDKDKSPESTIVKLINNIIDDLNTENEPMCNDNFDIHFSVGLLEDEVWYELNGLIQEAYQKRNEDMPQHKAITKYLSEEQLERFKTLSKIIIFKEGMPKR